MYVIASMSGDFTKAYNVPQIWPDKVRQHHYSEMLYKVVPALLLF